MNLILSILLAVGLSFAETKPNLTFEKGRLDKKSWSTSDMTGKVHVLFYVDPDKKNLNNAASEALRERSYDRSKFQSIALINMKASWLPNAAIGMALKKKQKKYPNTLYVKDFNKGLEKGWNFKSKGNDIFVFDVEGNEVFRHLGKLDEAKIKEMIAVLDKLMGIESPAGS